jgi:acyl-CoA reductase-like NAD-dependent aldehyde dehydrogenase
LRERRRRLSVLLDHVRDRRDLLVDAVVRTTGKSRTDALVSEVFPILNH